MKKFYISIACCTAWRDPNHIYIRLRNNSPLARALSIAISSIFLLPAIILLFIEPIRSLPIIILNIGFWLYFWGRETLWEIFGQELIIINRQTMYYLPRRDIRPAKLYQYSLQEGFDIQFLPATRWFGSKFGRLVFSTCDASGSWKPVIVSIYSLHEAYFPFLKFGLLRFFHPEIFRGFSLN